MEKTLIVDLVLPGSITALKFCVKLAVDQQFDGIDLMKAALALPVDIAFLGMAFGIAVLAHSQSSGVARAVDVKVVMALTVTGLLFSLLVTICSKRSDRAFDANRTWSYIMWTFLSYAVSFATAWGSLSLGSVM
jgi:hypothetical protein